MTDLSDDYFKAAKRQAEEVYDYRVVGKNKKEVTSLTDYDDNINKNLIFLRDENNIPIGWVIPNLLLEDECSKLVKTAESFGLHAPGKEYGTLRTSKRTKNYVNEDLSDQLLPSVKSSMESILIDENSNNNKENKNGKEYNDNKNGEGTNVPLKDEMGPIHSLHSNWRIVRYDTNDCFPAHQDQMDSYHIKHDNGKKDFVVSSHTLLVNISPNNSYNGGATRFYPSANYKKVAENVSRGPYDYAIDVFLPCGWGLVFKQKGLIHAGQPIDDGDGSISSSKYVAQAGVLRLLPINKPLRPSIFKLGPGLEVYRDKKLNE